MMKLRYAATLISLLLLALAISSLHGGDQPEGKPVLDPDLPYRAQKSNPVTYDVDFSVVVTAPSHTKLLRVWLPLPQTDVGQEITEGHVTSFPMEVEPQFTTEKLFGNHFAYFEFKHPEGAQIIRHTFRIKVWELHWDLEPARVTAIDHWPTNFGRYLRSDHSVVVNDRFRAVAAQIVPERHGEARDLEDVFAWTQKNMTYNHAFGSLRASAEHALDGRVGHCSDYHGLCAALGRSLGYPTRVTYGINAFPKNSPSHCKLEAYLPPYGWVSFDVSETQLLMGRIEHADGLDRAAKDKLLKAATERFRSGFRDNTWYMQTKGTDYDLAPSAKKHAAVVRTAYVEADGVALPDPDPANPNKHEFAWMTVHKYTPDRTVSYPFADWKMLRAVEEKRGLSP